MLKRILCLVIVLASVLTVWAEDLQTVISYYRPEMSRGFIFVSKADMTLTLVSSQGREVVTYPIACGRVTGQKRSRGDNRTPEGHFLLQNIHDAREWNHDFRDGKGVIRHAYGPWFLRLQTGFPGIGIHGTHAPQSIGTRTTEGCIRLNNAHVAALRDQVTLGMPVIIGPEQGVQALIAANVPRPATPGSHGLSGRLPVAAAASVADAQPVQPVQVAPVAAPAAADVQPAVVAEAEAVPAVAPELEVESAVIDESVVADEPAAADAEPETDVQAADAQPDAAALPTDGPQYEVVVEEVIGPDGEVRFEVRYRLVEK